jgi:molybdopterin converting factor small subunit
MSDGISVAVRVGGPLRDVLGQRHVIVLPTGATVQDLLAELARSAGAPAETVERVAVARSGAMVPRGERLADGDEVAVVAPVAGG